MSAFLPLLVTLVVLAALPLPYAVGVVPPLRRAPVTMLLLAANVAVFLATHISLSRGLIEPIQAFNDYGLVPADVDPLQLVTYTFLHVSGAHVLWNMLYLYLFGPSVEEKLGSPLYAALYVVGGAAAGVINSAIVMHVAGNSSDAYVPVVGASGAISAVLGLFTVFAANRPLKLFWSMGFLTGQNRQLLQIPAVFGIALWLAQTVYGAAMSLAHDDTSGVAYFTHIGGFIVGVLLGLVAKHVRNFRLNSRKPISAPRRQPTYGVPGASSTAAHSERDSPSTSNGLVALLERAVDDCDRQRATALHEKCLAMGVTIPQLLLNRCNALNRPARTPSEPPPSPDTVRPNG